MTFLLKKTAKLLSLLAAISILSFLLVSYSPIDPIRDYVGAEITKVSPEQRQNIAEYWGLNESRSKQFMSWAKAVLHGDLGQSLIYRKPVADIIANRFTAS